MLAVRGAVEAAFRVAETNDHVTGLGGVMAGPARKRTRHE